MWCEKYIFYIIFASEFAALGMVLAILIEKGCKTRVPLLALFRLGAALIDETIQLFVVGRSGSIEDVWIDIAGFSIGVLLVSLIVIIYRIQNAKTVHQN